MQNACMHQDLVKYGLTYDLWKGFPFEQVFASQDRNVGIGLYDDFTGFGLVDPLGTNIAYYQSNGISYKSFEDDAGIAAVVGTAGGATAAGPSAITLTPGTHGGDDIILMAGSGTMTPFAVVPGTNKDLIFECRFKVSAITVSCTNIFIGLGGTAAAANNGVRADSDGVLASNNFLGFARNGAKTSELALTYQRVGGTEYSHDVGTLVADTWTQAGFKFDGTLKTLTPWIDGVEDTTHRQSAVVTALTPWPSLYMNFIAESKYAATAAHVLTIDWWRCGQLV